MRGRTYPAIDFLSSATVVVDVGANVGAAAIWFAEVYPRAEIYGFEPHRQSYDYACSNTKSFGRIHISNFGLSDHDHEAELFIGKHTNTTNSVHRARLNSSVSERIDLRDAASAIAALGVHHIDILKIDTEGCEVPILSSILGTYAPKAIYMEYHNEADRLRLDQMLSGDYILYASRASRPHVGETIHIRLDAFPDPSVIDAIAVRS
ncbi:FkbM family methyltransferase [Pelagibius sp.]|uniref:FkbM family methyltransferase n=1 Tax=Pelagibius sp. TaxID=1931238 RepID=UPI00263695C5|nr:FkbM family methyltransferase [Pelagibius sp.]